MDGATDGAAKNRLDNVVCCCICFSWVNAGDAATVEENARIAFVVVKAPVRPARRTACLRSIVRREEFMMMGVRKK